MIIQPSKEELEELNNSKDEYLYQSERLPIDNKALKISIDRFQKICKIIQEKLTD